MNPLSLLCSSFLSLSSLVGSQLILNKRTSSFGSVILPSDPLYNYSWHLRQIEADKAWEITTGLNTVTAGFIDSGVDGYIIDLLQNLDAYLSVDCYGNHERNPLEDDAPHGTCVASAFGAADGYNHYVSGVTKHSRIVSLKTDDPSYPMSPDDGALLYSLAYINSNENSLDFVNCSVQLVYYNDSFLNTVSNLISSYSGLVVAVAGNGNDNLDSYSSSSAYQTFHNLQNVIVVGASNENDEKCSFSNYGQTYVDLFAPGTNVFTYPIDSNTSLPISFSGTCAAAPLVTGTAALIKSVNPTLSPLQIKSIILDNVDYCSSLNGKCVSNGRLNTYKAVKAAIPEITTFGQNVGCIQSLPSYGSQFYKAQLTPGTYHFETTGNLHTIGYLFTDIQSNPIISTSNSTGNFSFDYNCGVNKTVYLKVASGSYSSGDYGIKITRTGNHSHSYNFFYFPYSTAKHKAYCECGAYIYESHVVAFNSNACSLCGRIVFGDFISPLTSYTIVGNDSKLLFDGILILGPVDYDLFVEGAIDIDSLLESY